MAVAGEQGLYGTGQGMVFGIQVTDMGVFLGISLGVFVGWMVNKFGEIKHIICHHMLVQSLFTS